MPSTQPIPPNSSTPKPDKSDDGSWEDDDVQEEREESCRMLTMANMLALRALVNHMQVCLVNGDLDKTEALIDKSCQFMDQLQAHESDIGARIDDMRLFVAQQRQYHHHDPDRDREPDRNQDYGQDYGPDSETAETETAETETEADLLFKYLADDTRKAWHTGHPDHEDVSDHNSGPNSDNTCDANAGGIDDFYRRYHHDVQYSANVSVCCSKPSEECGCEKGSPPTCSMDFVNPWKGPLHRSSDSAAIALALEDKNSDRNTNANTSLTIPPRAVSAPTTGSLMTGAQGQLPLLLPPPPPPPLPLPWPSLSQPRLRKRLVRPRPLPLHLLDNNGSNSVLATRRRSSNISPKTKTQTRQVRPRLEEL